MANLIPEQLALLHQAADLRAGGKPWAAVATELKVPDAELRGLRAGNAGLYDRLARRAEREFERETVRAALTRLCELMKSGDESVAMLAAGTVVRYELARMRLELAQIQQKRARLHQELIIDQTFPRAARETPRLRNELPPPPSRPVTAGKSGCDSGCDSTTAKPQAPAQKPLSAEPPAKKTACDSAPAAAVTPPPPSPTPAAPLSAPPQGKTTTVDAVRRKKWLPERMPDGLPLG
jgi:hypothetical protein